MGSWAYDVLKGMVSPPVGMIATEMLTLRVLSLNGLMALMIR